MKRIGILVFGLLLSVVGFSQSGRLIGNVYDMNAEPLASATVVLLDPIDSTLAYFGISDGSGQFMMKDIREGEYLLQASFIGLKSFYRPISIPRAEGSDLGAIILQELPEELAGVEVVAERVPLRIKGDTIEFDASAFKTHADAVTEDLIRKLPGIEVDRAGNIKALGEDVTKVYVDGKEFFGSDPTVATRNLPADAIDKVQVYDKKSDATEFTGIDDGTRDKTINLKLKEDKKKGVFGNVLAGGGTDAHYKASAKAYRFSDKIQFAGLGMLNNVNQYGFSFGDYLDFQGGIGAMMLGGSASLKIESDDNMPIDFGMPVEGLTTSGAGGLNFSVSKDRNNRTYISYLANGSRRELWKTTGTRYFLDAGEYVSEDSSYTESNDLAHRINFGLRRRFDSLQNLIVSGNVAFSGDMAEGNSFGTNRQEGVPLSELASITNSENSGYSANANASYIRKFGEGKSVLKLNAAGSISQRTDMYLVENESRFFSPVNHVMDGWDRSRAEGSENYSGNISYTFKLGKRMFLTPKVLASQSMQGLDQDQLYLGASDIDEGLSPEFEKRYAMVRPALNWQYNTEKLQLLVGIGTELGSLSTQLDGGNIQEKEMRYVTPVMNVDWAPRTGRKTSLMYSTSVLTPDVTQLLPVENAMNPMMVFRGNRELEAELMHNVRGHWFLFDQFSFTSVMLGVNGSLTQNKINWVTEISDSLVQHRTLENMGEDLRLGGNIDFSTPIRKLGMELSLGADADWNKGLTRVNGIANEYRTISHDYKLSIGNRKKEKLDVEVGMKAGFTKSRYEFAEVMDRDYFDVVWFADFAYDIGERIRFEASADINRYMEQSFGEEIWVPLLRAELSYYFMKYRRATLSLSGFDLLNRNQIVMRTSDLNYMRETRSNTISQYFLLSFKYRLNKMEKSGGLDIDIKKR